MSKNKLRRKNGIYTGGFNNLQNQIILLRGFISEEILLSQTDISKELNRPLQSINYNIRELKKRNILDGLNFLTSKGKVVFLKMEGDLNNTKRLRAHKIFGTFILKEPYADFEKVRNKYLKISNSPTHKGFRLEFRNCITLFYTPTKILFYLPDIYIDEIPEVYVAAYEEYIAPLQGYLEELFPGIKISNYDLATITINHLAYMKHPLAECFNQFKVRYVSNRIEIDCSHNIPELETVHKKHSVEDMDKILEYEEFLRWRKNK
jgi:hypothetical protein